jgi:xanthine dehydrogenase accessory factor
MRDENDDVLKVLDRAADWLDAGQTVALATVVQTWGSSPRPVGSQMAVAGDGSFEGSVSGGCVEGAVVEAGREAMADGKSRLLTFGVSDDDAWAVGLACGGTVRIFVEPVTA